VCGWYSDKSVLLQEPGNYLSVCIFESVKFTKIGEYDNMLFSWTSDCLQMLLLKDLIVLTSVSNDITIISAVRNNVILGINVLFSDSHSKMSSQNGSCQKLQNCV